jgi:hypothetical protein
MLSSLEPEIENDASLNIKNPLESCANLSAPLVFEQPSQPQSHDHFDIATPESSRKARESPQPDRDDLLEFFNRYADEKGYPAIAGIPIRPSGHTTGAWWMQRDVKVPVKAEEPMRPPPEKLFLDDETDNEGVDDDRGVDGDEGADNDDPVYVRSERSLAVVQVRR